MNDARKALCTKIPDTENYFKIYSGHRKELIDIATAPSENKSNPTPPKSLLKDFVNHADNKKERDPRPVKLLDIPLSFSAASLHAVMSRYGKIASIRLN